MPISILIATAIPVIFLYLIWTLEIYAVSQWQIVLGATVWGIIAFEIAFNAQNALIKNDILSFREVSLFNAPVFEECLKAALIIVLIWIAVLRYAADGAAYGFAIGTGFAIAENIHYVTDNPDASLAIASSRVLSVSLIHAFTTGLVGTIAGSSWYYPRRSRFNRIMGGFIIAVLMHGIFNQIAYYGEGISLVIAAIIIGLSSTAIIVYLMQRALATESDSIRRELSDKLSQGEIAATLHPNDVAELLAQHSNELGNERVQLIQQFITLQAQRGILSKTKMLNRSPKLDAMLDRQLIKIDQQITALRSAMGLYTWVWLRSMIPSEESEIWEHLDSELHMDHPVLAQLIKLNERQAQLSQIEIIERLKVLQASSLFKELKEEDIHDLALLMREHHYTVGDAVIVQNTLSEHLYCVASGSLIASAKDENGLETIVSTFSFGDSFGELSMFDMEPHPTSIVAADHVKLYRLSREDLLALVYAKPPVGLEIMRQFAKDMRQQTALLMWIQQTTGSLATLD
jgi:RsiW-degrading membrane proteinase PrsW (M82 family)